jgi:hypothetical protein
VNRDERATHALPAPPSTPTLKEVCVGATDEQALEIARPYLKRVVSPALSQATES